jgi:hypothetical protein
VKGVGPKKFQRFGEKFLELLRTLASAPGQVSHLMVVMMVMRMIGLIIIMMMMIVRLGDGDDEGLIAHTRKPVPRW